MKSLLLTLLFCSNLAFGASKLIEYQFGNQITGSKLTILEDGTVKRTERLNPVTFEEVPMEALNQEDMDRLKNYINELNPTEQTRSSAGSSGFGSSTGHLHAFRNGQKINIRTIEMGSGNGAPQPIIFNSAIEAREIETLVFDRVFIPMPF